MESKLTIGKLARGAGVNVETIRYYERRGLLSPDGYRDSGYRLYTQEALKKIRFIKNAQKLGFTLKEITGLLRLRVSHSAHCGDVKKKAERKLGDVREKIAGLKALEKVLRELIESCEARAATDRCPILKSLEIQRR